MLATRTPSIPRVAAAAARSLSTTAKVWVDDNTKVVCQGFTGKQVCAKMMETVFRAAAATCVFALIASVFCGCSDVFATKR
jgi:hypothetical protein